ncbi:fumarylacetoacetate hydrolase family protein [Antarcticimicrobium luteum]|uniref:Fumarylacetoacetate hydrolase family protein n=1 Tax=Antarcticimicrobium luteum TaxID=2547397 RepID=A0A4R5UWR1_9RHOB|nr:fumarylacetoacetate hydrolase family protein [Antarcticimicrobium luteum]TDK43733.1 fumarylacetoacetate hydrolase family protein [Antarcticimicrobium luteum]
MRLATVCFETRERVVAALPDDRLVDLHLAAELAGEDAAFFVDMMALIYGGDEALAVARVLVDTADDRVILLQDEVEFRPPVMPVQYRDCLVFEEHLFNCLRAFGQAEPQLPPVWYDQPIYYKGNRLSFIGHGQDVIWPNYAEHLDIELELAIVVGKKGVNIRPEEAEDYIFGYTILNDVSARDAQMKEMPGQLGPAKGKDFDTGNILGPYILTADEVAHPVALDMEARVNGERWGGGNSRQMQHDFGRILEHISASETLYPGEVIGSGTVGTGCGLETGKRLAPGDRFELEIEKIGVLANRIVKP